MFRPCSLRTLSRALRPQLPRPTLQSHLRLRTPPAVFSTSAIRLSTLKPTESEATEAAKKASQQKLKVDPANVTADSTVRSVFGGGPPGQQDKSQVENQAKESDDPDFWAGLRSDVKTIRETFDLGAVPKQVKYLGYGGLIPYVATSASTMLLAWDMNNAAMESTTVFVNKATAEHMLHLLEPVQIGLGAVILSFLGAVHWGLEMAKYGGSHPNRRYGYGIAAPIAAWPTILLPFDYALIAQFTAHTVMYFMDAQAVTRGWAPKWYTTYRFVLTFVLCGSLAVSLIGRSKIGDDLTPAVGSAREHFAAIRDSEWKAVQHDDQNQSEEELEEEKRIRREKLDGGPKDPGKKAKGDQEGTQGVYADEKQGTKKESADGGGAEPTGEKREGQKPMEEGQVVNKKGAGTRG